MTVDKTVTAVAEVRMHGPHATVLVLSFLPQLFVGAGSKKRAVLQNEHRILTGVSATENITLYCQSEFVT
jgi:hypothetical protein